LLSSMTGISVRIAWEVAKDAECDTQCRGELSKESFMLVGESGRGPKLRSCCQRGCQPMVA
jgi:hypothetical protein